jgi:hypothetical protein
MDQGDIDRELKIHIDLEAEDLLSRGLPAGEARRAAHLALGNTTSIKEAIYEMKPSRLFYSVIWDAQQALHSIRLNPKYSIALISILAACLGANMAVFSIVYSVLIRPLPVPEADRIVIMRNRYPRSGSGASGSSAAGDYFDRIRGVTALEEHAMYNYAYQILENETASERIRGMVATPPCSDCCGWLRCSEGRLTRQRASRAANRLSF